MPIPNLIVEIDRENIRRLTDVAERRRDEEAHQEIAERYERQTHVFDAMLSAITDFVYFFDGMGDSFMQTRRLLDLWGPALEAVVGKNFSDLKYPDDFG